MCLSIVDRMLWSTDHFLKKIWSHWAQYQGSLSTLLPPMAPPLCRPERASARNTKWPLLQPKKFAKIFANKFSKHGFKVDIHNFRKSQKYPGLLGQILEVKKQIEYNKLLMYKFKNNVSSNLSVLSLMIKWS